MDEDIPIFFFFFTDDADLRRWTVRPTHNAGRARADRSQPELGGTWNISRSAAHVEGKPQRVTYVHAPCLLEAKMMEISKAEFSSRSKQRRRNKGIGIVNTKERDAYDRPFACVLECVRAMPSSRD